MAPGGHLGREQLLVAREGHLGRRGTPDIQPAQPRDTRISQGEQRASYSEACKVLPVGSLLRLLVDSPVSSRACSFVPCPQAGARWVGSGQASGQSPALLLLELPPPPTPLPSPFTSPGPWSLLSRKPRRHSSWGHVLLNGRRPGRAEQ